MSGPKIEFEFESRSLGETLKCSFEPRFGGNETLWIADAKGAAVSLEVLPTQEQNFLLAQSLALNDQWCEDSGVIEVLGSEEDDGYDEADDEEDEDGTPFEEAPL